MATSNSSSVWLKVRFLSPAPIFIILVMISLCVSASAIDENTLYKFSDFPYMKSYSGAFSGSDTIYPAGTSATGRTTSAQSSITTLIIPTGTSSGQSGGNTSIPNDFFTSDFDPYRFIHLRWQVPRNDAQYGLVYQPTYFIWYTNTLTGTSASRAGVYASLVVDSYTINSPSNVVTCYYYNISDSGPRGFLTIDAYFSLYYTYSFKGLSITASRGNLPTQISPSDNLEYWGLPTSSFWFEVSTSRIVPGSAPDSGGSVDLSGITSQINSLSAQMTASFNQVNANIDSAETSISQSIDNQTSALQGTIHQEVNGLHDHFESWDRSISDAFSPADGQAVVDANSAVSGLHTFEENQIDDTGSAIDDTGLSSYQLPSDYTTGLSEMGNIISLLFNSLGFVTPLIIFSCTLGIASVLVGRKSHEDG